MAKDTDEPTAPEESAEAAPAEEAQEPQAAAGPEAPTEEAQEPQAAAEPEAPAEPATEPAPEAETPAEPEAEAAAHAEPAAEDEPAAEAEAPPAPAAEPEEQLSPKQRRRRARSLHVGEAKESRSPEQRHAERLAERGAKSLRRRARRQQERVKARAKSTTAGAEPLLAPVHAATEGKRKVRQGIVVSDKAEKTIVVRIDVARRHRRYEKIVRSSSTLHAHDENNDAHEGDIVRVIESRPLSRTKRWRLVDVLERAR
jgi:small subunit ribosomal protein S17